MRLRSFFNNPAAGMEYNKICNNRWVSRKIYDADIARNPRVVKEPSRSGKSRGFRGYMFADVHAEVDKINDENHLVNNQQELVNGRY